MVRARVMHAIYDRGTMTDDIQEQADIVLRLQQATREMQEARARRPRSPLDFPTDEEEAAKQRRNVAIVDLRKTGTWPQQIAGHAEVSVDEVRRVLYEAGEDSEYGPVAERDLTIRPPD
jgi:hypothetical protein